MGRRPAQWRIVAAAPSVGQRAAATARRWAAASAVVELSNPVCSEVEPMKVVPSARGTM